jgi:hypothetical protein
MSVRVKPAPQGLVLQDASADVDDHAQHNDAHHPPAVLAGTDAADERVYYTMTPSQWLQKAELTRMGENGSVDLEAALRKEGLLQADFSGIRFIDRAVLRELGLTYGDIMRFEDARSRMHEIRAARKCPTVLMDWFQQDEKPRLSKSHGTNYDNPAGMPLPHGYTFPAAGSDHSQFPYGVTLTGKRVGGVNWATMPVYQGGKDSSTSTSTATSTTTTSRQLVSGVLVMLRVNIQTIYRVDTVSQTFKARVVLEAYLDLRLHPGLLTDEGAAINPHTWSPRIHFANLVEVDDWACRPTVLLNTQTDKIDSIRWKFVVHAVFSEPMELTDFPFDVQALHVTVYSKRNVDTMTLYTMFPAAHSFQVGRGVGWGVCRCGGGGGGECE